MSIRAPALQDEDEHDEQHGIGGQDDARHAGVHEEPQQEPQGPDEQRPHNQVRGRPHPAAPRPAITPRRGPTPPRPALRRVRPSCQEVMIQAIGRNPVTGEQRREMHRHHAQHGQCPSQIQAGHPGAAHDGRLRRCSSAGRHAWASASSVSSTMRSGGSRRGGEQFRVIGSPRHGRHRRPPTLTGSGAGAPRWWCQDATGCRSSAFPGE